jgi:mRNA (2'-O-methyladenosine-N6-)-methyltransferase
MSSNKSINKEHRFNPKTYSAPKFNSLGEINNGWYQLDTWHESIKPYIFIMEKMLRPLAMYPSHLRQLRIVSTRERLLSNRIIRSMSNKTLLKYQHSIKWYENLWAMIGFYHWYSEGQIYRSYNQDHEQNLWRAPPLSCPIRCNINEWVTNGQINFINFAAIYLKLNGRLFDVIVTDPPWQLAGENATRGVALNYDQMKDSDLLSSIPFFELMNPDAILFMWVINSRYVYALDYLTKMGFHPIETLTWAKISRTRLFARGHGYYLQHAKEECIVAIKGDCTHFKWECFITCIPSEKRFQSQKPTAFYDMVESMCPNGNYLEIFSRRNNLRDCWISLGNQL